MASRLITGLTPTREQAFVERMMLRLARQAEKPLQREIARAMRDIARNGDDAIELHNERMNRIISNLYKTGFDYFGRRLWVATQKSKHGFEKKKDVPLTPQFDLSRQLWIKQTAAQRVTEIAGTTLSQAHEIIRLATEQAIEEGLDEKATARLIQQMIGEKGGQLSTFRSRMIARTESHAASTSSSQMAAKASGLPLQKEWISSGLERTRDTHRAAHGQTVDIDQPFTVGYSLLMQPGDPSGPAEEVINCRCIAGYSL